ncbi:MAG: hypothetical protein ABEJ36_05205 [Candidatus Nanosalina sp.]
MNTKKGQLTFEYILSSIFFIIVLTAILYSAFDHVEPVRRSTDLASVNQEARRISTMMLTSPGRHSLGSGGTNWQKNETTIDNIESFGLATDYHVVKKAKIMALDTRSSSKLNYSQFKNVTSAQNEYRMIFTVMPVAETPDSFTRTQPPDNPDIVEPDTSDYLSAGNTVRYGSIKMRGVIYNLLVTSHDGRYDTVYRVVDSVDNWNFTGAPSYNEGEKIPLGGQNYRILSFQNRGEEKGTAVIMKRQLKIFGSVFAAQATVVKMNRYAVLKQPNTPLQPLRIEVYAWKP